MLLVIHLCISYLSSIFYLGRSKAKALLQPVERVNPVPAAFRKQTRPKALIAGSSKSAAATGKATSLLQPKATHVQTKSMVQPASNESKVAKSSGRNTYSLKDRVIHMLALKPHTREQIVAGLKKGKFIIVTNLP